MEGRLQSRSPLPRQCAKLLQTIISLAAQTLGEQELPRPQLQTYLEGTVQYLCQVLLRDLHLYEVCQVRFRRSPRQQRRHLGSKIRLLLWSKVRSSPLTHFQLPHSMPRSEQDQSGTIDLWTYYLERTKLAPKID
jgi:hypothetical protein